MDMDVHRDASLADPNLAAIDQAGLPDDAAAWLREVAAQVEPRLDRSVPHWRHGANPAAARAAVFGLLLGRLAGRHPPMAGELSRTVEAHSSFDALGRGNRLATLSQLAADPPRAHTWLSGMIEVPGPDQVVELMEG